MNWIEWLLTGIGIGAVLVIMACGIAMHYVTTHMNKYGPLMFRGMMKRAMK